MCAVCAMCAVCDVVCRGIGCVCMRVRACTSTGKSFEACYGALKRFHDDVDAAMMWLVSTPTPEEEKYTSTVAPPATTTTQEQGEVITDREEYTALE